MKVTRGYSVSAKCPKCGKTLDFGYYSVSDADVVVGNPIVRCKCGEEYFNPHMQEYDLMTSAEIKQYKSSGKILTGFGLFLIGMALFFFILTPENGSISTDTFLTSMTRFYAFLGVFFVSSLPIKRYFAISSSKKRMKNADHAKKAISMTMEHRQQEKKKIDALAQMIALTQQKKNQQ